MMTSKRLLKFILSTVFFLSGPAVHAESFPITPENSSAVLFIGGELNLACFAEGHLLGVLSEKSVQVGATFRVIKAQNKVRRFRAKLASLPKAGHRRQRSLLRLKIGQITEGSRACAAWQPDSSSSSSSAGSSSSGASSSTSSSSSSPTNGPLIIDHAAARDFDKIPARFLAAARAITFQYAHRSDGSDVVTGLQWLADPSANPAYGDAVKYGFAVADLDLPAPTDPPLLRMYDGSAQDTYVYPELYWLGEEGRNQTRAVVGSGRFNFSMWSWCDELQSWSSAQVKEYFAGISRLESEFPGMRFIYMTGFTDGADSLVKASNNQIRNYARSHNKILFDYADIESWDPDGNRYPDNTRECSWCDRWCSDPAHAALCDHLPSSAHSHGMNSVLQGKAFWYMLARLAGWDGASN